MGIIALLVFVIALVVLDVLALRCGAESRDSITSPTRGSLLGQSSPIE